LIYSQDLEDVSEQFQQAQRTHSDKVSALLKIHRQRIKQLEAEFQHDLTQLKAEFETERWVN